MAADTFLAEVKQAIPITTDAYDTTITELIASAVAHMNTVGIPVPADHASITNPLHKRAIKTFVKLNFTNENADADRLAASYKEQISFMLGSTGYHFAAPTTE